MAEALLQAAEGKVEKAIIVTNRENARAVNGAQVFASGHPVPDAEGERAALAVEALLQTATAADRVVALISGGGSALLPAPVDGISLADKAATSRLLLASGFDIAQMNLVRQSLSRLKGGGFLRMAAPAPVTAYILSDVIGDDLRVIASGLTVAPVGPRSQARHLLETSGLWPQLPLSVQQALNRPDPTDALPPATNILIGSNRKSLDAVLAAAGAGTVIVDDALTGDVADVAARIVVAAHHPGAATCLVFGGETTVTLSGNGLGGRNQELALRVALSMPDLGRDWAFLSGGTDGRDGPTDAAGGLVNAGTSARITSAGGDPSALLANNDSYQALALSGDLLITGGTGTNVADVQILLLGPRR
jgi:hydroxypyruvate reductase